MKDTCMKGVRNESDACEQIPEVASVNALARSHVLQTQQSMKAGLIVASPQLQLIVFVVMCDASNREHRAGSRLVLLSPRLPYQGRSD